MQQRGKISQQIRFYRAQDACCSFLHSSISLPQISQLRASLCSVAQRQNFICQKLSTYLLWCTVHLFFTACGYFRVLKLRQRKRAATLEALSLSVRPSGKMSFANNVLSPFSKSRDDRFFFFFTYIQFSFEETREENFLPMFFFGTSNN